MITTVVVEGAIRDDSVLSSIRTLSRLAEIGEVSLVKVDGLFEAAMLGFSPHEVSATPGVLRVAGCQQDPPDRSMHYVLESGSLTGNNLHQFKDRLLPTEWNEVRTIFDRLKTRYLTCVDRKTQAGLVWEKLAQQEMVDLSSPRVYTESLPTGDSESEFRRFIDDSVNMLSELEMNRRREDEGKPQLNVFWPWGGGVRLKVPNLALRFGIPRGIFLDENLSLHLSGLARLAGYRPYPLTDWSWNHPFAPGGLLTLDFSNLNDEELEQKLDQFGSDWMESALTSFRNKESFQLIFIDRNQRKGLRWLYHGKDQGSNFPLDERSFDEKKIQSNPLFEIVTQ